MARSPNWIRQPFRKRYPGRECRFDSGPGHSTLANLGTTLELLTGRG